MRLECSVRSRTAVAVAVGLAAVLVLGRGDADDPPELVLAAVITDQHGQELGDVEPIALGAAGAAVDLDAGGVDDEVVDARVARERWSQKPSRPAS